MIKVLSNSTFTASFLFEISDEDITSYLNSVGDSKSKIQQGSDPEAVLRDVAAWMVQTGRARNLGFDRSQFQVQVDPEQVGKIRQMFNVTEGPMDAQASLKVEADGGKNPAQAMASEALKVAKELSNLLNMMAGLQNRAEITKVTGLENLPEIIERTYQYADTLRQGNIMDLQQPQATFASNSWDPEKLRKQS